ncbi:MAG: C_GCAxxG_C_C family protein [Clostridia bacterium]|nr:C_GCAxxG_C_C family protein [Clostridia bacterium]
MSRAEKAKEYFNQGYACSQAVALAFSDLVELDEETLSKMTLPFGGGLGRLRLTCGAVSGMAMIAGLLLASAENTPENKKKTYERTRALCAKFEEANGSLICNELLTGANLKVTVGGEAEARTAEYYKKRPCSELVYCAAEILESYLREQGSL